VQHLHRVGRASRAGATGTAVAIYDSNNTDLLSAITRNTKEVIDSCGPIRGEGEEEKEDEEEDEEKDEEKEEEEGEEYEGLSSPSPSSPSSSAAAAAAAAGTAAADSIEQAFSRRRGLKGKIKKNIRRARMLEQEQQQGHGRY